MCSGFRLEHQAFQAMVRAFDPEKVQCLDLAEYIALTLFMKSASATFYAFDPQNSGLVTLDFNQFVYAASNVV